MQWRGISQSGFRRKQNDAVYITLALEHQTPLLTAERTTTPWVVKLGKLADIVAPER